MPVDSYSRYLKEMLARVRGERDSETLRRLESAAQYCITALRLRSRSDAAERARVDAITTEFEAAVDEARKRIARGH